MKIVIDIPEEMHEQIMNGYVPLGISKYLKNATPLSEVLDSIKGEIEEQKHSRCYYEDEMYAYRVAIADVLEIIDKYGKER